MTHATPASLTFPLSPKVLKGLTEDLKTVFQEKRAQLEVAFDRDFDTERYLSEHASALDDAIVGLAQRLLPETGLAVAAVGGYGRKELYPFSDIDLLVLVGSPYLTEPMSQALEAFSTALWSFGLSVGLSVRDTEAFHEEALKDVSVATTYLEHRFLFGSEALLEGEMTRFLKDLNPRHFFRDKMLERERRYQRFEETPYALEPNLKESPGGLRDLQVFLWCAKAAGLARNWEEMATQHLVTQAEYERLMEAHKTLQTYRIALHLSTKRHEDRLLFDVQETLAARLGVGPDGAQRASERLMKRFYLEAKAVTQINQIEIQTLEEHLFGRRGETEPVALDETFALVGNELDLLSRSGLKADPQGLLRAFYLRFTTPGVSRFSTRLMRAIWHAAPQVIDEDFRHNPENRALFLKLLAMKHADQALELLNAWGVLERLIPAFSPVVGQMQHDLYHIFTVDQHTLRCVRNVARFSQSEFAHEYPLCSQLAVAIPEKWPLLLAALFHDIGKGQGGQHAEIGAKALTTFCQDWAIDPATTDFVVFLVREHLLMSKVAQKEDTSDPEVIARFAKAVGSKPYLDALYLLTVADIRATSPKVWTPWKAQLLEGLYLTSLPFVSQQGDVPSVADTLEARREKAKALLTDAITEDERQALWDTLDVVYLMRNTAEDIAWQTKELCLGRRRQAALGLDPSHPIVKVRLAPKIEGLEVLLSMPDRKDLFLRAVAFFGHLGLSVLDARIHTTVDGLVIDTFLLTDRFAHHEPNRLVETIERELPEAFGDGEILPYSGGRLSRRSRHFPTPPELHMVPTQRGKTWLLSITTTDRVGLLFDLSQVFTKWHVNLETAKIATLGERVEDVFRLSGAELANDETLLQFEADVMSAIAPKKRR